MRKLRNVGIAMAIGAVAAIPLGGSLAGAQDAGDCGTGSVAASAESVSEGGLIGSLIPLTVQVVAPINAPILAPSSQNCNANENTVTTPSWSPSAPTPVAVAATPVGGAAPQFTG